MIRESLKPIPRPHNRVPDRYRRMGADLAVKLDVRDVAYLFDVRPTTVYKWRWLRTRKQL